jgi:uncharacterized protein
MFSVRNLFGKGDQSFALLTASAEEGLHSVQALQCILNDPARLPKLDDFAAPLRKVKTLTEEIRKSIEKSHSPTIDREEIEALSLILYKVPKTIEKFAERYFISVTGFPEAKFDLQVQMLDEAVRIVVVMFHELKRNNVSVVTQQNFRLQQIEGDADKLMLEQLRGLYSGQYQATVAIALKDLYEILEKAIDHCRDAGNAVAQVVLKHS